MASRVDSKGAKGCKSDRSRPELSNEFFFAKIGFNAAAAAAENEAPTSLEKDKHRSIVVLSPSLRGDSEEFDLVHNVTSRSPELDGLVFKLKVYVVEREGNGDLYSLGYNDRYQLGHKQPEVR